MKTQLCFWTQVQRSLLNVYQSDSIPKNSRKQKAKTFILYPLRQLFTVVGIIKQKGANVLELFCYVWISVLAPKADKSVCSSCLISVLNTSAILNGRQRGV